MATVAPSFTAEWEETGPLWLDADSNGREMTAEEFDAVEEWDEEYRYELVRGIVIVSPPPVEAHEDPIGELFYLLRQFQRTHPQGNALEVTLVNRYIPIPNATRRLADLVAWCGLGRLPRPKTDVPAIAVEMVSRGKRNRLRDYQTKREEYRAAGVREYWIIDRFRRVMTVFFADGAEKIVTEKETYTTPLLPGFELPLARLLALADQWEKP